MNKDIGIYEGVCSKVNVKKHEIPNLFKRRVTEIYGYSTITIKMGTDNIVVPISANTSIEEGNMIRVHSLKISLVKKNDNTYEITNPLLIKTITT